MAYGEPSQVKRLNRVEPLWFIYKGKVFYNKGYARKEHK